MNPSFGKTLLAAAIILANALSESASGADRVRISNGVIEGSGAQRSGVRVFKGIPFAQPPTGVLRWKEPQPVTNWDGARQAIQFGPRCMQAPIFGDLGL